MTLDWLNKSGEMLGKWRNELLLIVAYFAPAGEQPPIWILGVMLIVLIFWRRPVNDLVGLRRITISVFPWVIVSVIGLVCGHFVAHADGPMVSLSVKWLVLLAIALGISSTTSVTEGQTKAVQRLMSRGDAVLETVVAVSAVFFGQRFWPDIWLAHTGVAFTTCAAVAALWALAKRKPAMRMGAAVVSAGVVFLATKLYAHTWDGLADWAWLFLMSVAFSLTALLRHALRAHSAGAESLRLAIVVAVSVFLYQPLAYTTLHGTGDALWYATMLADMLEQVRHGIFPVWSGQSIYQFNGAIYPLRVAPAFHYIGAGFDLLSLRTLNAIAVQNLMLTSWGILAAITAYVSLAALRPVSRNVAVCGAILFAACPGVMSVVYNTDLFMSWMTIPFLPIVFYALVRSFQNRSVHLAIGFGAALGFMWWGHTPIALWTTIVAAVMQVLRLLKGPKDFTELRFLAFAAVAFLAVAAYPIISVLAFPPEHGVNAAGFQRATAENIVYFLRSVFPAVLLPIQKNGVLLSSFQLGYSLWLILVALVVWGWRTRNRSVIGLTVVGLVFAALLTPVTKANLFLWTHVPAFVRDTTGNWVMNRLYSIFAATVLFAGATALMLAANHLRQRGRRWLIGTLIVFCCWSVSEGMKFSAGSKEARRAPETAHQALRPENIMITRFAYLVFPRLPDYFTHGVADPHLEFRFFSDDGKLLWSNGEAILDAWKAGDPRAQTVLETGFEAEESTGVVWKADRDFTLKGDEHYLVLFNFTEQLPPPGIIQLKWDGQVREYALPEYGGSKSFGNQAQSAHYLPLWSTVSKDAIVQTRYLAQSAVTAAVVAPLKVTVIHYDPGLLPAQVKSWMPLRVELTKPAEGWLETPRSYHVDYLRGSPPGRIKKSEQDLVMVKTDAAERSVTVKAVPPISEQLVFWLSFFSIFAAFGYCGIRTLIGVDGETMKPGPAPQV